MTKTYILLGYASRLTYLMVKANFFYAPPNLVHDASLSKKK